MDNSDRYASIDLGSNTALLLVVEKNADGQLRELHQEQRFPRLGEGLKESGRIKAEKLEVVAGILREYLNITTSYAVRWVDVVATAALREARNGLEFALKLSEQTGLAVRIISGEEEARYAFLGALSNKQHLDGNILVVDIGGGSTEFIWGKRNRFENAISIPIGSVKLTEMFHLEKAVSPETLEEAGSQVARILQDVKGELPAQIDVLVGTAGTMTTLAATAQGLQTYDSGRIDGFELSLDKINELMEVFRTKSSNERLLLPGIVPGRQDVILGGTILAREILQWWHLPSAIISDRGLRFGVILERLQQEHHIRQ